MTLDEIKSTLTNYAEDPAKATDAILTEFSEREKGATEKDADLAKLTEQVQSYQEKIAALTDTNTKLIEKIKYQDGTPGEEKKDEEPEEITVEDLDFSIQED